MRREQLDHGCKRVLKKKKKKKSFEGREASSSIPTNQVTQIISCVEPIKNRGFFFL